MSYLYLAFRYLFHDRKRTIWTIAGVTLVAAFLYCSMWVVFSLLAFDSAQGVYHVAVDSTDTELIRELSEDDRVRRIQVGSQSYLSNLRAPGGESISEEEWINKPILFLTLQDQKLKRAYAAETREKYGVKTAWVRQDEDDLENDGSMGSVLTMLYTLAALFSFVATLPGVIMVRNSIQLSTMEQIRDYGNLRCIGATRKQIRRILYLQGVSEVSIGLLGGMILALIVSGIANPIIMRSSRMSLFYDPGDLIYQIRVDIPSLLFVTFAFFFDLYFLLNENLKRVYGMTPSEAISGQYRFISRKIRPRKSFLIRKLFGIEGEYAYKSMMRNPARIWKNVGILAVSVAFIASAIMGLGGHFNALLLMNRQFPYYQIRVDSETIASGYSSLFSDMYLDGTVSFTDDSASFFENSVNVIRKSPFITDSAPLYQKRLLTSERVLDHLNPSISGETYLGRVLQNPNFETNFKLHQTWDCRGFREEEKAAYEEYLSEGTLDLSENGLAIINGAYEEGYYSSTHRQQDPYYMYCPFIEHLTTLKLGDSILVPDPIRIEEKKNLWLSEEYDENQLKEQFYAEHEDIEDTDDPFNRKEFAKYKREFLAEMYRKWYEETIEEGDCKTYQVEGILSKDPLFDNFTAIPILLMPLDEYLDLTGDDEKTGMTALTYHVEHPLLFGAERLGVVIKKTFSIDPFEAAFSDEYNAWSTTLYTYSVSEWAEGMSEPMMLFLVILLIIAAFLFLAFINIRNATQNSIFLRKKELAQLFVIGCTNRTLGRMLRYEGVISGLLSLLFGCLLTVPAVLALKVWYGTGVYFDNADLPILWWLLPFSIGIASLLVVGFYAFSLGVQSKKMSIDPASDLTSTGE